MKQLLITTIAVMVLVGCVPKKLQKTKAIPIQQAEPPTTKAPAISILDATAEGKIKAVKQHLTAGTNVNERDDYGWTPLHPAAVFGHKEIAELLIAKGANVNAKANDGRTPLDWSANGEIADLLRKHGGKSGEELKAEGK